ncbi:hypothetical protein [Sphingomonas immobilis]|uniref:Uncharacterized protein n=1 Tax=Sphingomonas immobilis TaxID=3063997 RepID=A0ABT8ZVF6_9SPHN|nr:hypothetical protein [Sphingomonas sp. CA1-15]MDO7841558.1 hypothetical protein [Sphingomonas sp. CA1-15]
MLPEIQHCPICGTAVRPNPRYPNYLCQTCAVRAKSSDGRPLTFFNTDMSGGYEARYADNGTPYGSHDCYVDGVLCHADEARFGGIVIQRRV